MGYTSHHSSYFYKLSFFCTWLTIKATKINTTPIMYTLCNPLYKIFFFQSKQVLEILI